MRTQAIPSLSTVERSLQEVDEYLEKFQKLRNRLSRLRPGSDAYLNLLPDVEVALDVPRSKPEHAHEALEIFEDTLIDAD
jgi:hypothetical protein